MSSFIYTGSAEVKKLPVREAPLSSLMTNLSDDSSLFPACIIDVYTLACNILGWSLYKALYSFNSWMFLSTYNIWWFPNLTIFRKSCSENGVNYNPAVEHLLGMQKISGGSICSISISKDEAGGDVKDLSTCDPGEQLPVWQY